MVKVQKGQRAELTCDVIGDLPISVTWSRERLPLKSDKFTRDDSVGEGALLSRVFLRSSDILDSGFYTCLASNAFGR